MLKLKRCFVFFAIFFLGIGTEIMMSENSTTAYAMQTMYVAVITDDGVGCTRISGTGEKTDAITAQDIWKSAYRSLVYETESSLEKIAAFALVDVKAEDLKLMSSSTDRIVTYHGRRFAITEEDYEVLLKIVEAEASTEDIEGKMLVANVIMNRLEVSFCGDTIVEVVFAEGQFAPVTNGRFARMVPSEETIEAVERVLNGEDISQGALYFMQRNAASKKGIRWFDENLKFLFEHGCHEFYTEKN